MSGSREGDFILERIENSIEEPKRINILVGVKCGCLEVLDDGAEYLQIIDTRITNIKEEKLEFLQAVEKGEYVRRDRYGSNGKKPAYIYTPINFEVHGHSVAHSVAIDDFDEAISELLKEKEIKHYKCKCKKCGKIRYYSEETLQAKPKVCCKPIYCSSKFTYSTRASNANSNKRKKYKNNESVCLVGNRNEVIPATEYCDAWNEKRNKELLKQAEKDVKIIASIPRKRANNYDVDYVGLIYESLEVLECVNDAWESIPTPYYTQRHEKIYHDITVYKKYRCRCYLCGKEKMVTCDKFGIFPPTPYGYRAYGGYWSEIYCDCHPISSFQWIVNDILIKHNIEYRVEASFPDLYGVGNTNLLRYDFSVLNEDGTIKCLIECQGEQHYKPVKEFGGKHQFELQKKNDDLKRIYAEKNSIPLYEISYKNKKYEKVEEFLKSKEII